MSLSNTKEEKLKLIMENINLLLNKKRNIILAIDGRCASGKTSLANWIQEVYPKPIRILHMDDFYLPLIKRKVDWEYQVAGNMDLERFLEQALIPASQKKNIIYQPYSCKKGTLLEASLLEYCHLTIVEGSYAMHPLLVNYYDWKIFLSCSKEIQLQRLKEREGEGYLKFKNQWIPMEELYFESLNIEKLCDDYYDTSC